MYIHVVSVIYGVVSGRFIQNGISDFEISEISEISSNLYESDGPLGSTIVLNRVDIPDHHTELLAHSLHL